MPQHTNPLSVRPPAYAPPPPWWQRPLLGSLTQAVTERAQKPVDVAGEMPGTYEQVLPGAVGAAKGGAELLDMLQTPEGLAVAGGATLAALTASTSIPAFVLWQLLKAGFTASAIQALAESAPSAVRAFQSGDTAEGMRQLVHSIGNLGMAVAPQLHRPAAPAPGEGRFAGAMPEEAGLLKVEGQGAGGEYRGHMYQSGVETSGEMYPPVAKFDFRLKQPEIGSADPTGKRSPLEIPRAMDQLLKHNPSVDPRKDIRFFDEDGTQLTWDEFRLKHPEVQNSVQLKKVQRYPSIFEEPTEPTPTPEPPAASIPTDVAERRISLGLTAGGRTRSGYRSYAGSQLEPLKQAPGPKATGTARTGTYKPPTLPPRAAAEAAPEPTPQPAPAPAAQPAPDPIYKALTILLETNQELMRELRAIRGGVPTPPTAPAAAPQPVKPEVKPGPVKPAAEAAPSEAPPLSDAELKAMVEQSIAEPSTVKLTAAEAGKPAAAGPPQKPKNWGKMSPEEQAAWHRANYEQRTAIKERERPAEPTKPQLASYRKVDAAGNLVTVTADVAKVRAEAKTPVMKPGTPVTPKAETVPTDPVKMAAEVEAFKRGERGPINIRRVGVGGAPTTTGTITDVIYKAGTDIPVKFEYLPNKSAETFEIGVNEIIPLGTKTHEATISRFGGRTFGVGEEFLTGRPAVTRERFRLPQGGTGTKVDEVIFKPEQVDAALANYRAKAAAGDKTAGDTAARMEANRAKEEMELASGKVVEKGGLLLYKIAMGEDVPHARVKHPGGPPPGRISAMEERAAEGEVVSPKTSMTGAAKEAAAVEAEIAATKDTGVSRAAKVEGRTQNFYPSELRPVAEEMKPTKRKPSRKKFKATEEEEKRIRTQLEQAPEGAGAERREPRHETTSTVPWETTGEKELEAKLQKRDKILFEGQRKTELEKQAAPSGPVSIQAQTIARLTQRLAVLEAQEKKLGFRLRQADDIRAQLARLRAPETPPPPK